TVRTATPFPMVSLFLVFTAFVISNVGHIRPQRTLLAFVSGIFFILSGHRRDVGVPVHPHPLCPHPSSTPSLSLAHPVSITGVMLGYLDALAHPCTPSDTLARPRDRVPAPPNAQPPQGAGVMSVYLFTKRYAEEELYRAPSGLLRPRLSACSGLSGQFLQPRGWPRPRSPSEASSDVSIQMTQNYPPAIKYPQHGHLSTSPC
ncbi:PREDICTED: voltage-dependent calcium channel gamma-7 subunit-like, partial [Calidris pugnax]|uniref:voltage-dependent calcium channel gamma-7 subunit-like n=1 Tax=Calidris pugnax TaxID=198806 RepID=UPI00071E46C0